MSLKPDLVFNDAPNTSELVANVFHVESSLNKPSKDMFKTLQPDGPIIEDWTSDSKDEIDIESVPKQKEPSFASSSKHVKTPREFVKKVEHPKQAENLRTNNQQSRDADAAFDVKEIENDVHVSPSGSDKTANKKHDDKAKRVDKGKSHVDLPTIVRD
nr:hypothetical protein [Tanacetum cinerariifolium]